MGPLAMDFIFLSLGMLALIAGVLVLLARAYPGSGADLVDWKPTRSPQVEAELEVDDVQQMIEAQNEYRRRRGAEEIGEADAERWAKEDQAVRERGSSTEGPAEGVAERPAPPTEPRAR